MAFYLDKLKKEYENRLFFTSDRECIEYLLSVNLEKLEEYGLLVMNGEAWIIAPDGIDNKQVKQVLYEGYSNRRYQNKIQNILDKINEFSLPDTVDTAFERQVYSDYFQRRKMQVNDVTEEVKEAALIKTDEQIKTIENCVHITENAYRYLMNRNVKNETELSLFRYVEESIMEDTSYANGKVYDFLAGNRTAEVSGFPSNYKLCKGDTLIADLLPRHNGVYADMTRTFFAGEPTACQRMVYEILLEAMGNAEGMLKPGNRACDVYESVWSTFKKHGMEEKFPHHAGHGLGMGYYDAPYFLKEETDILQENMIVAIEPGLYLPNEFGIRIENNYLVTAEGPKRLGNLPTDMEDYILTFID